METLSTSVPTLKLHTLPSTTSRELHLFKPSNPTNHLPIHTHLSNKHNQISNKPTFSNKPSFTSTLHSTTPSSSPPLLKHVHTKASSGYAAALINVARSNNTLESVEKDVRRFSRLLWNKDVRAVLVDPFINDGIKEKVVKELVEKGKFQRDLVVVVKMVIGKNKVGMVNEVLEEFERIYNELHGIQVVLVSSEKKLEEDQLFGIARKVQKMSGGLKVKVRNLIKEKSPSLSFAV